MHMFSTLEHPSGYLLISLWLFLSITHGQTNATTATPSVSPSLSRLPTSQPSTQTCTDEVTCNGQGTCTYDSFGVFGACACNDGWITFPFPKPQEQPYCNYAQKQQLTAFLLHFFLGAFGAGRFYIDNYVLGGLQLAVCVLAVGSCCVSLWLSKEKTHVIITGFVCVGMCSILVWWAADCVLFGLNIPTDASGVALEPW